MVDQETWDIQAAEEHYNIRDWGINFFSINELGHVQVHPKKNGQTIDLKELVDDIRRQNLSLPVLVRFSDILRMRIIKLYDCFAKANQEYGFKGRYSAVYPIKVNQQRRVVEEILQYGRELHVGLEAGSKPELHAVLAMMDNSDALIICNGYKDDAFIRLALIGQKLNRKIIIVVEKPQELDLIFKVSKNLNIRPSIGLRLKLASSGSGRWQTSSGDDSKFGLNSAEIMQAIETAKVAGLLDCLELLHCHLGSQITNIRTIKDGLKEISRFYKEMVQLGCPVKYIDVGGGLGVDYDGTRSTAASSANYSIQEYANDIVYHLCEVCQEHDLPHPDIISESGRALTAHHSLLVFDVLETTGKPHWDSSEQIPEDSDNTIADLHACLEGFSNDKMLEDWHDAMELKDQAHYKFNLGLIGLKERAQAERLFWSLARKVYKATEILDFVPEELVGLREKLAEKYFCNFSVFQSLPDSWAVDQVFPIMPIHRLNEAPTHEAILQDITCDSDGNVSLYVHDYQVTRVLSVHEVSEQEPYLMGAFLVGAYQEILGDMHNLFGDTNTVHVALNEDGTWRYEQIIEGDNITTVLAYVQYKQDNLLERMQRLVGISLGAGSIQPQEAEELMQLYRQGLQGYTYLVRT